MNKRNNVIFIFIYIIFNIIIYTINSQEIIIENIYINNQNGNDNSGNGTIINPYRSICILNHVLFNKTLSPPLPLSSNIEIIIVNIGYGDYISNCKLEIININNITITPYSGDNQQGQQQEEVNLKNINFNISNSNIRIQDINIEISSQFKINISKLIILNSKFTGATSDGSGNDGILNSMFTVSNGTSVYLENIMVSSFINFNMLILINGGGMAQIKEITFTNCIFNTLISTDQSPNSNITIDGLNLINNNFKRLIYIQSTSNNINITNIITICDNVDLFSPPTFITTSNMDNNGSNSNYISITNVNFNCFGNSIFKNSNIQFENISITKSTFSNNFITLLDQSNLSLVSSNFRSIYNLEETGYFILLDNNSTISIGNCNFTQIYSPLINSLHWSTVSIYNSNFINTKSNYLPFISINNYSILHVKTVQFNQHYTLKSSTIYISNNSNTELDHVSVSDSWFDFGYFFNSNNSNTDINLLIMNDCFSQNSLFISTSSNQNRHNNNYYFQLANSSFKNNNNIGPSIKMFNFENMGSVVISSITLESNSFSPFIQCSNIISLDISFIKFQKNTGSFLLSEYGENITISNFTMKYNTQVPLDYLISISSAQQVSLQKFTLVNNYFSKNLFCLYSIYGNVYFNQLDYYSNHNLNNLNNANNNEVNSQIGIYSTKCLFENIMINSNFISVNLIYISRSLFEIRNSVITNNIIANNSTLFKSYLSETTFNNTKIIENQETDLNIYNTAGIINCLSCDLTILNCEMSRNNFENSNGTIVNFQYLLYKFYQLIIRDSKFINNIGNFGGVFSICEINFNAIDDIDIKNNTFSNNYAKTSGGVFYTPCDPMIKDEIEILDKNLFYNNTKGIVRTIESNFSSPSCNVSGPLFIYKIPQVIQFNYKDDYGNPQTEIFGQFQISTKCYQYDIGQIIEYTTSVVFGGNGSFNWENKEGCSSKLFVTVFRENVNDTLKIELSQYDCPEYMFYDYMNNTCKYCPVGETIRTGTYNPPTQRDCYPCDISERNCIGSNVFTYQGYYYYSIYNEAIKCAFDMCNQGNVCPSTYYTGDLCYHCLNSTGGSVVAKNGIQCCNQFKPILIIPILIVITCFSLLLSIGKYYLLNNKYAVISSLIIFIQSNSVVYFWYRGIYILPIFRLSIDLLDGYCLWSNLDYNDKSIIIYTIILVSLIISCSNVTLFIINSWYYPMMKRLFPNSRFSTKSKFIKKLNIKIMKSGNDGSGVKCIWSLFQLYIIPLLFNSFSLLVPMKSLQQHSYLAIDFSIVYMEGLKTKLLFFISLVIFSLVSIIILSTIIIILIGSCGCLKSTKFHQFKRIFINSNYNDNLYQYCWDHITMFRSISFVVLPLTMIFSNTYYMLIITSIQIVYSTLHLIFNPFKKHCINLYRLNNIINVSQLILILTSGTTLFQLLDPSYKGIIVSSCSLFIIPIILILNFKPLNFSHFILYKIN